MECCFAWLRIGDVFLLEFVFKLIPQVARLPQCQGQRWSHGIQIRPGLSYKCLEVLIRNFSFCQVPPLPLDGSYILKGMEAEPEAAAGDVREAMFVFFSRCLKYNHLHTHVYIYICIY